MWPSPSKFLAKGSGAGTANILAVELDILGMVEAVGSIKNAGSTWILVGDCPLATPDY